MASEVLYAEVSPKERVNFISEASDTGKKSGHLNIIYFPLLIDTFLKLSLFLKSFASS